jgi:hypothetical protein
LLLRLAKIILEKYSELKDQNREEWM